MGVTLRMNRKLIRWIVWFVVKEEEERRKQAAIDKAKADAKEAEARRDEMRKEAGLQTKS